MSKYKGLFIQLSLLFIITIPALISLFKAPWFSIHDDQHIARLFLLDQSLKQGYFYPRWVDTLGFGFGYPLFNFYPPAIYYIAEIFHLVGFSLLTSIKLMIVGGYFFAAVGMYFLAKKYIGKAAGLVSAVFYTYFTYHAIVVYVRGALAEFFTMAILPFIFLSLHNLFKKPNKKNAILFGILFALLIITHPLIALPSTFFIVFFIIFYILTCHPKHSEGSLAHASLLKQVQRYFLRHGGVRMTFLGIIIGLSLSVFFWLPSLAEKKYTLADTILTGELANYKLHYIFPQQLWYSPWGYGGSAEGLADGISFQLGKIHIGFALLALIFYLIYRFSKNIIPPNKKEEMSERTSYFTLSFFCLLFSLFMSTPYSSFIWDNVSPLWYIQFPWRFLTFAAIFISLSCGYFLFLLTHIVNTLNTKKTLTTLAILMSLLSLFFYQKYFYPQRYINTNDSERTSFEEIAWRISRSSYDFVPNGVKTTKTQLGTTIVDIEKNDISTKPFRDDPNFDVKVVINEFAKKWFVIDAKESGDFQLNTYNFPGWEAYIDGKRVAIKDNNKYKLITITVPRGNSGVQFYFEDTLARTAGKYIFLGMNLILVSLVVKNYLITSAKKIDA